MKDPHGGGNVQEVIISSDSHVMEPPDLWATRVPEPWKEKAPRFPEHKVGVGFQKHPGGHDPHARIKEMEVDGLSAEVLYPTLGLELFGLDDAKLQEACFRVYNDWLIDYCRVGRNLEWWGEDNCMWSNDFPHPNSTWPNSRQVIERDLGHLPAEKRAKLLNGNVVRLYNFEVALPTENSQSERPPTRAAS